MIRFTDITFHANHEYADTDALLDAQQTSLYYVKALAGKMDIEVVKHITGGNTTINKKKGFFFFASKNRRGYFASATRSYVKKRRPDIVLVRGLSFPFHILRLKPLLHSGAKILVMHHADKPPVNWLRRAVYRWADACIDGYLFTSRGNAEPWIEAGIIRDREKLHEIPGTLTNFTRSDQQQNRHMPGMPATPVFLWVGRFDANKDPLTVIDAFAGLINDFPSARLHMIYQEDRLSGGVQQLIARDSRLREAVTLVGKVSYDQLPQWYSNSDFFVSGSHSEGGSAALLEAMACGCIPIVTAIPSAMKVIGEGEYGFHFPAGDAVLLCDSMKKAINADKDGLSVKIISWFQQEYSVDAVSDKLYAVCKNLMGE